MVSAGDHRLMLYCTGQGGPTVVIEPGMGQDWTGWRLVWQRLTPVTRVCVYDRAGYGWSDGGPRPRTAGADAEDLHAMLVNAREPGPYVLAAHSFGGYIARIFASRYRESVAGIVLLDPSHEDETMAGPVAQPRGLRLRDLTDAIPALGVARLKRLYQGPTKAPPPLQSMPPLFAQRYTVASSIEQLRSERNEFDSLALTFNEVRAAPFPRETPLTVITALYHRSPSGSGPAPPPLMPPIHREVQIRLSKESASGRQIIAEHSGHFIYLDEPDLVAGAVLELVQKTGKL
jgi:pimeloyl-ACP methyl ester carboxylesterase